MYNTTAYEKLHYTVSCTANKSAAIQHMRINQKTYNLQE